MIHLVTAVSRPENLPRIHRSIGFSLAKSSLAAKWILVVDGPGVINPAIRSILKTGSFEVQIVVHREGSCSYGIEQKNAAMELIVDGYYHCIDDDNIVHQNFFQGLEQAMKENPSGRAFVFGQQRWDNIKSLVAAPDRMEYGKIDNTMFVVHSSVIGDLRYDLSKSGREDFHFFRKLYDLHREAFVFIPETLAYYNFIKHFPAETKDESVLLESALRPPRETLKPSLAPASPVAKISSVMKIALYSSKRERCGISTYTSQLEDAFLRLGHEVRYYSSREPYDQTFSEIRSWRPDVFHAQHETSIMPPDDVLKRHMSLMSREGIRTMITLHTEDERTIKVAREATLGYPHRIVMHRPTSNATEAEIVPMPCTVFGARPAREALRQRFGIPQSAFLISTVGFMIPWKEHPKIVELMVPWLLENPSIHLQIIASEHFSEDLKGYADACRKQLAALSEKVPGNRIHHVDGYPDDLELIERLMASDLGYVWCPFDTGSSSAAAAQFTTARCPVVGTDSSHYAFLGTGMLRARKDSLPLFVKAVQDASKNSDLMKTLTANQWVMYRERNYLVTALKHLDLYQKS